MASDTQIANLALLHMGVSELIANLATERSSNAEALRAAYSDARDYCLSDFPWPWARAYAELGLVGGGEDDEPVNGDWQYSYRFPSSCLRIRRLLTGLGRLEAEPPAYAIGRDDDGRLIFTNEADAVAEYTFAVIDAQEFDPVFVSMFSWKLAADTGPALSRLEKIAERAMRMYELEKTKARAAALNEEQDPPSPDAEWIRSR